MGLCVCVCVCVYFYAVALTSVHSLHFCLSRYRPSIILLGTVIFLVTERRKRKRRGHAAERDVVGGNGGSGGGGKAPRMAPVAVELSGLHAGETKTPDETGEMTMNTFGGRTSVVFDNPMHTGSRGSLGGSGSSASVKLSELHGTTTSEAKVADATNNSKPAHKSRMVSHASSKITDEEFDLEGEASSTVVIEYERHLDPATGRYYNIDPRTGTSHWDGEQPDLKA